MDADGTIYLSGYYGPDLIAISPDGGELWRQRYRYRLLLVFPPLL